ncbi:type I-F CRISPR-associated endoribonuclease Cas6/Csy4 [Fluviispira sanaruensis]|uniref:Uncharacterized protein n=1 Tax=Fluviispira sanaruensis TaxID=2493639 RepID=A0A4P2VHZ8_FLUSA|nr:type I-F CRISPR-associated endoribonuclease Cas6/Csy4 [Fluviispira sanaruensis]BBH52673.1 hypothetical protein JCM31447_11140 [Fluviispira sanaruensis]
MLFYRDIQLLGLSAIKSGNFKFLMRQIHGFIATQCLDINHEENVNINIYKSENRLSRLGVYFPHWSKYSCGDTIRLVGQSNDLKKLENEKWIMNGLAAEVIHFSPETPLQFNEKESNKAVCFKRTRMHERLSDATVQRKLRRFEKRLKDSAATSKPTAENYREFLVNKKMAQINSDIVHGIETKPSNQKDQNDKKRSRNIVLYVQSLAVNEFINEQTRWNSYGLAKENSLQGISLQ